MEILYRNDEPCDWFDRQALRDNPLSMACRNRRKLVTRQLARLIAEAATGKPVTILGVGAGPGRHVQEAIVASKVAPGRITAWLIDRDDEAFEYGRCLASSLGVARSMLYVCGDARNDKDVLPAVSADIVKLVGLVEYLSDVQLVELLCALRNSMAPRARLLTHGLNDPFRGHRFLERVFDLHHCRRTESQMATLLETAGFRPLDCIVEPVGVYPIITAERRESNPSGRAAVNGTPSLAREGRGGASLSGCSVELRHGCVREQPQFPPSPAGSMLSDLGQFGPPPPEMRSDRNGW
jgi:hypothetical protein